MTAAREAVRRALRSAAPRLDDVLYAGARLVVGFSGGQDSTCLLHALVAERSGFELVAAHVDHALRADSAETAEQAARLARAIGAEALVRRIDVAAYRRGVRGWSVQQAARAARYQVLLDVVRERDASALLVAHTADDQAETVLLNLLRGSGLAGLGGMRLLEWLAGAELGPPLPRSAEPHALDAARGSPARARRVRVARPLLTVTRPTTLAYCSELGLPFVEDASNRSRAYTRNRVRLDLLPALEQFNPAIRGVLARTADLLAEDESALEHVVDELHVELASSNGRDEVRYDLAQWQALPRGLQRRLLRHGLQRLLGGSLQDVPAAPIDDALDLLRSTRGGQAYHLPYGVELCTRADSFELRRHGRAQHRRAASKSWEANAPRV